MIDSNGISLLYYAYRFGQYSVAKCLLEHGANIDIQMITKIDPSAIVTLLTRH
jgi:ankyrin repeat protein